MVPPMREPTYVVLAALLDGPLYGYAIVRVALELSDGRVRLTAGTLYGALQRLSEEALVAEDGEEVVDGRTRRYYRLTDAGRQAVAAETARLASLAAAVQTRLGAGTTGVAWT